MPFDVTVKTNDKQEAVLAASKSAEPTRFFFGKDQEEWVGLRLPEDADIQRIKDEIGIRKKYIYVPNPAKDNAMERVLAGPDPDQEEEFVRRLNHFQIPEWNIIDNAGNKIPHSIENVDIMLSDKKFSSFVLRNLRKLATDQKVALEAELKNS